MSWRDLELRGDGSDLQRVMEAEREMFKEYAARAEAIFARFERDVMRILRGEPPENSDPIRSQEPDSEPDETP